MVSGEGNTEQDVQISFQLDWSGIADIPTLYVNELRIQRFRGEIILAIGQFDALTVTPGDSQVAVIPVKVVAKLGITRRRFLAFARAMGRVAEQLEAETGDEADEFIITHAATLEPIPESEDEGEG